MRAPLTVALLAVAVAATAAACELAYPLGGYGPGTADGGTAGSDGATDAGGDGGRACPAAPAVRGAPMVTAGTFCVDAHEVTQSEYRDFVEAKQGNVSGQAPECADNTSYVPGTPAANGCDPAFYAPATKPNQPVVCVDWCDAVAYCTWAGKRLCGHVGGGTVSPQEYLDPTRDQWLAACSAGGARAYPYGNDYDASACNGSGFGKGGLVDVGTLSSCSGGYPGLVDMSGNAWEWEDACKPAADGGIECHLRGGSYAESTAGKLRCDSGGQVNAEARSFFAGNVGFRCCE